MRTATDASPSWTTCAATASPQARPRAWMRGIPPTQEAWRTPSPSPTASRRPRESTSSTTCRPEGRRKSGCRPRPRPARATLTSTAPCASARPLEGELAEQSRRVRRGLEETRLSANLRGKPAVIVDGRADGVLPPNYASRAYYARNKAVEPGSRLYYYEVTHAHHLDVLNGIAGFDSRYVPLNVYLTQALNLMWD